MVESSELSSALASLRNMESAQLRTELAQAFRITVEQIVRMAAIIRILEERGDNLEDLKFGLLGYLRRVAYGQTIPEALVKLQSAPALLDCVVTLPLSDQKKVVDDDPIDVVGGTEGEYQRRPVSPLRMRPAEIKQVFAKDCIRSPDEQIKWLESRRPSKKVKGAWTKTRHEFAAVESLIIEMDERTSRYMEMSPSALKEMCSAAGAQDRKVLAETIRDLAENLNSLADMIAPAVMKRRTG